MLNLFIILYHWHKFNDLKMNKKKWHRKKLCNKNYINISMAFDNLKFSILLTIFMKTLADFLQNVQVIHSM